MGKELNLLDESPEHCQKLKIEHPVLTGKEMEKIRHLDKKGLKTAELPILFSASGGETGMKQALDDLCQNASKAIKEGVAEAEANEIKAKLEEAGAEVELS